MQEAIYENLCKLEKTRLNLMLLMETPLPVYMLTLEADSSAHSKPDCSMTCKHGTCPSVTDHYGTRPSWTDVTQEQARLVLDKVVPAAMEGVYWRPFADGGAWLMGASTNPAERPTFTLQDGTHAC